jgi:NTE family protein
VTSAAPVGRKRRAKSAGVGELRVINLALQGGGAHGAYTWGVLDRLLEDSQIGIEGISGTSAGAMNAVVLAQGFAKGGADGARAALSAFWREVSELSAIGPIRRSAFDAMFGHWSLDHSPTATMFDIATRVFSPYQTNPLGLHPLRPILNRHMDVDTIRNGPIKLFISATNVFTGKIRVFDNKDLTPDAVLASACLPFLFQAIEIDGEPYWDGGYMGNPAMFPLIYGCESRDIALVVINPLTRRTLPKTAAEIMNRVNEISFNSSLMREMRAIAFVQHLIDAEKLDQGKYHRMLIHMIGSEDQMSDLGVATKLNADLPFLLHLRDLGRAEADRWIILHRDSLGREPTVDIRKVFF